MAELPTARLLSRDAKDQLAVASARARRVARHAPGIARWVWSCLLSSTAVVYVLFRVIAWALTARAHVSHEPPRVIHLDGYLRGADQLEVVDVPSPTGRGTIRTLARKRTPPAPAAEAAPPAP